MKYLLLLIALSASGQELFPPSGSPLLLNNGRFVQPIVANFATTNPPTTLTNIIKSMGGGSQVWTNNSFGAGSIGSTSLGFIWDSTGTNIVNIGTLPGFGGNQLYANYNHDEGATDPNSKLIFVDSGLECGRFDNQWGSTFSSPTNGEIAGVIGHVGGGINVEYGVIGYASPFFVDGRTNVGVAGMAAAFGSTGVYVGGMFGVAADDSSNVKLESSALLVDNFTSNSVPLIVARTNNSSHVATLDGNGVWTELALVITGTTNQITFGSTNTAPQTPGTIVKWISVQVQGENNAYRIPLYK